MSEIVARLPEHVSALLPKREHIYTIAGVGRGFEVRLFWRHHLTEVSTASTYAEARRIADRYVADGITGYVEGAL